MNIVDKDKKCGPYVQGGILFFNGRLIFLILDVENEPPVKKENPPLMFDFFWYTVA